MRAILIVVCAVLSAVPLSGCAENRPREALELLRAESYDEAISLYRRIADANPDSAQAHYDLAAALGFLRRYPEAVEPIETAIRLQPGFVAAYQAASIIYANNQDPQHAFEASLQAARLGESTAMFELVWMYRDGRGVDPDPARSLEWAERAANAGHVAAMDLLVEAYLNGDFDAEIDLDKAGRWAIAAWRARQPGR